jgi:hypothetical protein
MRQNGFQVPDSGQSGAAGQRLVEQRPRWSSVGQPAFPARSPIIRMTRAFFLVEYSGVIRGFFSEDYHDAFCEPFSCSAGCKFVHACV